MSRRAKIWPRICKRTYSSGGSGWEVDCGERNGKRDRTTFPTKAEAEVYARQRRIERENEGTQAPQLSLALKIEAAMCVKKLAPYGASLIEATDYYITNVLVHQNAPTVAVIVDEMLKTKRETNCRPSWIHTLKYCLNRISLRFGDRQLHTLTKPELKEFCLQVGMSPRTHSNRIHMVSEFYNYAIENKWAHDNLAKSIAIPTWDPKEPGILTVEEIRWLLAFADEFGLLGYVAIAVFAGIRSCELLRLDWSAVHTQEREIVIDASIAKTRARRVVPYGDALAAYLALCARSNGPIVDKKCFRRNFVPLRKAAGIEKWPHNALRHSFASYHLSMCKDPVRTAYLMGHRDGTDTLDNNYKGLVSGVETEKFWALRPEPLPLKLVA